MEANLLNLILWRNAAAAEPVHEDLRARTRHLLQLLRHLVGIIGQRIDLFLRQRLREPFFAQDIRALFPNDDLFSERHGKRGQRVVVAAFDVERNGVPAKSFCFDFDLVLAGYETGKHRLAGLADKELPLDTRTVSQGDDRMDECGLRFILNGVAKSGLILRSGNRWQRKTDQYDQENTGAGSNKDSFHMPCFVRSFDVLLQETIHVLSSWSDRHREFFEE